MRHIKYFFIYFILLMIKPITGTTLKEIEDGSKELSIMRFKDIKKMYEKI